MRWLSLLVCASLLVTVTQTSWAEESPWATFRDTEENAASAIDGEQGQPFGSEQKLRELVGKTGSASLVLGLLTLLALWAGQRRVALRRRTRAGEPAIRLIGSLSLGPRCALQLVQVENQRFLVARDGTGVGSITAVNSFPGELVAAEERLPGDDSDSIACSRSIGIVGDVNRESSSASADLLSSPTWTSSLHSASAAGLSLEKPNVFSVLRHRLSTARVD